VRGASAGILGGGKNQFTARAGEAKLRGPVFEFEPGNAGDVPGVAGDERRAVGEGDAGDEEVGATDILHLALLSVAVEEFGDRFGNRKAVNRIEVTEVIAKPLIGADQLFAVRGFLQEFEAAFQDFDQIDDGDR
jgi:hypothetical protein